MPTSRSYRDQCGVARALDIVGERWALLVVRELLFVPQRFSELRHALPNASSNLLADRLRELEQHGVIQRRKLSGAQVYELTERGRKLEPIVLALGDWGSEAPGPPEPAALSATSALIFLRRGVRHDPDAPPIVGRLDLDGSVWTVRVEAGQVEVRSGEPVTADVSLRTDPRTLGRLMGDRAMLDGVLAEGGAALVGDKGVLERLLYGGRS
ncbi:winged helix-turn-helix transcriptional regulator [Nonomuraea soli]|uniref:DNA-binding HxlR family transcriptional regulator n=1 Tax=Nonomuraea soli TaxID=1032476 RepID=A0A7W0HVU3_9ACTN|nr:winged helix-turn-helix transcriptional regulator [Nonomuraea soli]MBA2897427.1 DNA-binding HxlR family transcriptional regulator [Nonomuraea soli]